MGAGLGLMLALAVSDIQAQSKAHSHGCGGHRGKRKRNGFGKWASEKEICWCAYTKFRGEQSPHWLVLGLHFSGLAYSVDLRGEMEVEPFLLHLIGIWRTPVKAAPEFL